MACRHFNQWLIFLSVYLTDLSLEWIKLSNMKKYIENSNTVLSSSDVIKIN